MDRQRNGWMDGWMDGKIDRQPDRHRQTVNGKPQQVNLFFFQNWGRKITVKVKGKCSSDEHTKLSMPPVNHFIYRPPVC